MNAIPRTPRPYDPHLELQDLSHQVTEVAAALHFAAEVGGLVGSNGLDMVAGASLSGYCATLAHRLEAISDRIESVLVGSPG